MVDYGVRKTHNTSGGLQSLDMRVSLGTCLVAMDVICDEPGQRDDLCDATRPEQRVTLYSC